MPKMFHMRKRSKVTNTILPLLCIMTIVSILVVWGAMSTVPFFVDDVNPHEEFVREVSEPRTINNNHHTHTINMTASEPCALLFFGLVKEFKYTVLPSIQKNILNVNPHCDVFLHTYNLTTVPENSRSFERGDTPNNVSEAYLLLENNHSRNYDHIFLESIWSFREKREQELIRTRKNFHKEWGECCKTHNNMLKQWHSIQGVWGLMRNHEKEILSNMSPIQNSNKSYYKRVGLFRSDVLFITPINVDDGADANIPSFRSAWGYNDRLFYGKYEYAKIWATKRFDFIPTFEEKYMRRINDKGPRPKGYHSETFLQYLMNHYEVPVTEVDHICFLRVRSGQRVIHNDCEEYDKYDSREKVQKYLPSNVTILEMHFL